MIIAIDVFKALSDPVRIEIVQRLASGNNFTLGEISDGLGVTRQGARKHLDVLERADIVILHKQGRTTQVQFKPESLEIMKKFIAKIERQWDQRLLALKQFVEQG